MTNENLPLRSYRMFGFFLLALFLLVSASYFLLHVGPDERNVTLAGVVVPVPDGMKKVTESAAEAKTSGHDQEQIAFKGNVSPSMITRFYHNVMPAKDWQPDPALGSKTGGFAFTRGDQQLIINIAELEPDTSVLTIVVNPGDPPTLIG